VKITERLLRFICCLAILGAAFWVFAPTSSPGQEAQGATAQPQDKTASAVPKRVRVGGQVMAAKLVHKVDPKYPKQAKKDHVSGLVRMEIVVGGDGRVVQMKVVSGDPMLVPAATEAVQKWRYRPMTINGKPVEVVSEVDVNFQLNTPKTQ